MKIIWPQFFCHSQVENVNIKSTRRPIAIGTVI